MYNYSTNDKFASARRQNRFIPSLAVGVALLLVLQMSAAAAAAASWSAPAAIDVVVDALVADALQANLELDSAAADVTQRLAALDQAHARYLPALDLSARYTRASGGRAIEFPVGDLLNPVYASLNRLTGSSAFAATRNQSIDFQRTREQQTDLALTQPLYDARLAAARGAASAGYAGSQATRAALANRIRRDMREAYYHWLQAREQIGIYSATLELAGENLRVNRSLLANGKITPDLVYRAEADQLEVEQSLLDARNAVLLAQSYVNLLRNAPFQRELPGADVADTDIARMRAALAPRHEPASSAAQPSRALDELQRAALAQRPELRELDDAAAAAEAGESLARAAFKPQLGFALNSGIQGTDYGFAGDQRYVLASVVLKFNLFAGGADQAGLSAAHAALRAARSQREAEELQIRVQVQQALQDLEVAEASLGTAAKRVEAAAGGFRIAARKRDLGQINQAEFIDARRTLTDAELNQNITRFGALGHLAELEYALGAVIRNLPPESEP
jgi:outer membrane protein TolC